jgi:hypothetical protein
VTRLWAGKLEIWGSVPGRGIQISSEGYPASHPVDPGGSYLGCSFKTVLFHFIPYLIPMWQPLMCRVLKFCFRSWEMHNSKVGLLNDIITWGNEGRQHKSGFVYKIKSLKNQLPLSLYKLTLKLSTEISTSR